MPHCVARAAVGAALILLPLAACGDDDDATPTTATATADGGGTAGGTGGGTDGGAAPSSLEFVAVDIDFARVEVTAAAGDLDVTLVNEGAIEHSWLVEDHEDELRLHVQSSGDTDQGTISLDPGEYQYYCDIPGHREAGMEGTLTVG